MDNTNSAGLQFPEMSSNLSPYFRNLICKECISEQTENRALDEDGFLNFDFISGCLPESDGPSCDSPEYFTESVRILAPMLHSVEEMMTSKGQSYICNSFSEWTSWTNQQKMMTELYNMMFTDNNINDITILLASTAILERALGNVYLINGPVPCPSMLKDLLVSRPLIDLLGNSVIQVLRLVIGPPISLNIRNVAWHGFPVPGEIPRRCIWFILLLVPSIGQVLHRKAITLTYHRDPALFPEEKLICEPIFLKNDEILRVISTSKFVGWNATPFWNSIIDLYENNKYSLCACLLCYFLEQGLRRVFAVVNKCENRILTAECSALFTTFDEILNAFLPDNTENKLSSILGESTMEILFDHLVYQDGPRVRDRLSHGEADWFLFPKTLTDNLITLCISLVVRFSPTECPTCGVIADLTASVESYSVQFHRIALMKQMVSQLNQQIADFDSIILINTDLTDRDVKNDTCLYAVTEDHVKFEDMVKTVCKEITTHWTHRENQQDLDDIAESMCYSSNLKCLSMVENILHSKIRTLYRHAKPPDISEVAPFDIEGVVLIILSHVTCECVTTLVQLRTFACLRQQQLKDKQLRSRQRENFKKFLLSFPSYIVAVKLYGYLVTWQLYHLDQLKTSKDMGHITRFWKNFLQCVENLRTYTHEDKNKWTDGLELFQKHISLMMSTINKLFV